jgi:CDP-diacylglycerol--glycerol-3-phosphate 3-phosphatidyltransferase
MRSSPGWFCTALRAAPLASGAADAIGGFIPPSFRPLPFARTIAFLMFRHVPNIITAGRLVLAVIFFALLSYYQHEGRGDPLVYHSSSVSLLLVAFFVYLIALFSDFLDGYLARKWKVEGAFGRVVDPFVDKVLVLGTFIFFAGKNFVIQQEQHADVVKTITGVVPWMVVLILARELLVTSLRGISESGGANFGAAFSGKLKMVFQSVTILIILLYVAFFERRSDDIERYARIFRDGCIWLTIAITLYSGLGYVRRGISLYQKKN